MKASTPIFKILSAVMLAAVVIYFTVQAYRYFSDPINTTLVYATTEETVLEVNGYLIRDFIPMRERWPTPCRRGSAWARARRWPWPIPTAAR